MHLGVIELPRGLLGLRGCDGGAIGSLLGPGVWMLVLLVLGWEASRSAVAAAEVWPLRVVMI